MLVLGPDHLSEVGDGPVKVALPVIDTPATVVSRDVYRVESDGFGEGDDGLVQLVAVQLVAVQMGDVLWLIRMNLQHQTGRSAFSYQFRETAVLAGFQTDR